MKRMCVTAATVFLILALFSIQKSVAQWSAEPGETVRNAFGPVKNQSAPACRGACGMDCPSSCEQEVDFDCTGAGTLTRVRSYSCGTHLGCRQHDDCLDRCSQQNADRLECQTECNAEAVTDWGVEQSTSWAVGGGPFDGAPIRFEYTTDIPGGVEAVYACPKGARQSCSASGDGCKANGVSVDPVFVMFSGGKVGSAQISKFRSGRVCLSGGQPSSVCQAMVDIQVTGEDHCAQADGSQACTWYGFEFDYQNADPSEPLICQSSAVDEDFLGGIVSKVIKSAPVESNTEMGDFLGQLQKELQSGKSLDQVFAGISMTTADGEVVGSPKPQELFQQPGVPSEVVLSGSSGHVLVPMFELQQASPNGSSVEHVVRCLQQGEQVIETAFRLHFVNN